MISGVYKIQHTESGRLYVGSSKDVLYRLRKHKERLRIGKHVNASLQNAWNKHGEKLFVFEPMIICDEKDLLIYEQSIMDGYQSYKKEFGYNIRKKAESNAGLPSHRLTHKKGDRYNRLTLIELRVRHPNGNKWLCRCDCGKEKIANVSAVKYGKIRSCGCVKSEMLSTNRSLKEGEKYNRLTLISRNGKNQAGSHLWLCSCECGGSVTASASRIKRGALKSCGCLVVEKCREIAKKYNLSRAKR